MKLNHLAIKIILVTIACFVLGYLSSLLIRPAKYENFLVNIVKGYSITFGEKFPVVFKKNFVATQLQQLEINVNNTDVVIKHTKEKNIKLILNAKYFNIKNPDNVLSSQISSNKLVLTTNELIHNNEINYEGKITIEIPDTIRNLSINTQFGDIEIDDAKLQDLQIKTVLGDVQIEKAELSNLNISSVDADIKFEGIAKKINCSTAKGDAQFTLSNLNPILNFRSESGELLLRFPDKPNVLLNFTTVSGSLDIDSALGDIHRVDKMPGHLENNAGSLQINTVSGDAIIAKK